MWFILVVVSFSFQRSLTHPVSLSSSLSVHPLPSLPLTGSSQKVAAVQFHLINTTILLLAREGIRRGCITGHQQQLEGKKKKHKGGGEEEEEEEELEDKPAALKLAATAALSFPAGCLVAALLVAPLFLRGVPARSPHRTAVYVQIAAALVELAAEPLYVVAAARGELAPRVAGEAGGTLVRGVLSLSLLRFFSGRIDPGVALSLAQLGYALTWLFAHLVPFSGEVAAEASKWWRRRRRSKRSKKPEKSKKSKKSSSSERHTSSPPPPSNKKDDSIFLDRRALSLCGGFSLQAAEKLALAEGSRAVLAVAASPAAQGEFGLAANVGSLAVRTLFQPIEEAAFLAFARKEGGIEETEEKEGNNSKTRSSSRSAKSGDIERANALLSLLCRCVSLVGATGAAFGPPFAFALVRFAYGKKWACETAAPRALGAYAAYTALLALNGVLEAFVHARGGPGELARGNAALLALAVLGAAGGALGARSFGSVGLVAADAATMAARIAWSLGAVGRLTREGARGEDGEGKEKAKDRRKSTPSVSSSPSPPRLRDLLPSGATLAALALASCLGFASDAFFFGGRSARNSSSSSSSSSSSNSPSSSLFRCSSLEGRRLLAATAAHASVGALALAGVAAVALRRERDTIAGVKALRSGRSAGAGGAKVAQD